MQTYSEKVGSNINDLLTRTIDAKKGFEKAAENIDNLPLKRYFERKAVERNTFSDQLKSILGTYEQEVTGEGSMQGTAHRAWMDVKSSFASKDSEAMLEEAIRGEEKAVEDYEEVLSDVSLTPTAKEIIESQLSVIKNSLSTVKSLEDIE